MGQPAGHRAPGRGRLRRDRGAFPSRLVSPTLNRAESNHTSAAASHRRSLSSWLLFQAGRIRQLAATEYGLRLTWWHSASGQNAHRKKAADGTQREPASRRKLDSGSSGLGCAAATTGIVSRGWKPAGHPELGATAARCFSESARRRREVLCDDWDRDQLPALGLLAGRGRFGFVAEARFLAAGFSDDATFLWPPLVMAGVLSWIRVEGRGLTVTRMEQLLRLAVILF